MGKIIIVTAGPTNKRVDAVRHVTNMSTGDLGVAVVDAFCDLEATNPGSVDKIYYLSAKLTRKPKPRPNVVFIDVTDAGNLLKKLTDLLTNPDEHVDAVIHAAAVGDYKGRHVVRAEDLAREIVDLGFVLGETDAEGDKEQYEAVLRVLTAPKCALDAGSKISSYEPNLMVALDRTPKVVSHVKNLSPSTTLVAFKLLTDVPKEELFAVASELRQKNGEEYVVANDQAKIGNGMHPAMIIGHDADAGRDAILAECETKAEIAAAIVRLVLPDARRG